jgi:hypothetical protein
MSPVDDVIVDLDAALDRLASAIGNDDVETRRALRESLACLYELRVYRAGTSRDEKTGYHNRAALSQAGNRTEGIVWLPPLPQSTVQPVTTRAPSSEPEKTLLRRQMRTSSPWSVDGAEPNCPADHGLW